MTRAATGSRSSRIFRLALAHRGSASHRRIFSPVVSNYSPVNPLLIPLPIPCYDRTSSPVPAEFIAGSLGRERGFAAVSLPRGFWMRRGERRSAMLPQFANPMIFLFENIKVWHYYFSRSRPRRA